MRLPGTRNDVLGLGEELSQYPGIEASARSPRGGPADSARGAGAGAPGVSATARARGPPHVPQLGQPTRPRAFCRSVDAELASNRCPAPHIMSKIFMQPFYYDCTIMLADRLEGENGFDLLWRLAQCKVVPGDICAILSETQSRALSPTGRIGPAPARRPGIPRRRAHAPQGPSRADPCSAGASVALQGSRPRAAGRLLRPSFIADCTLEGLMHAVELPTARARALRLQ